MKTVKTMKTTRKCKPKVLPINYGPPGSSWYQSIIKESLEYYTQVPPVFNRDGWYYDRHQQISWVEIGGMAFLDRGRDMFLFELEIQSGPFLSDAEYETLKSIWHLLSKQQKRWLYIHEARQESRDIAQRGRKLRLKHRGTCCLGNENKLPA